MLLYFLGSSVTYGSANGGRSFVEMLAEKLQCDYQKEAVNGTTLHCICGKADSYVERLRNFADTAPDILIVQLSTNDATQGFGADNALLGTVKGKIPADGYDMKTTIGAIEYIVSYAQQKWGCRVLFYTNPKFGAIANYDTLRNAMFSVVQAWVEDIEILDFYGMTDMDYTGMYADAIHPNRRGYEWMAKVFINYLK